ncbi:hypothetical protein ANCDUO_10873 [Ancylostoma duodenale]|uniref:Cwf19-like C-terminal domain-containing protein n=1 Tax=Ancylostoma duodenale TaxID=51022 RepID=A0A0C2GJ95_9BILA|nr:hypothetical protein ANCDUO_10873 [Ancylostoma duodenale]
MNGKVDFAIPTYILGLQIAYLSGVEGPTSSSFQFNEDDIEVWKHAHNTPSSEVQGSKLISRLAAGLKPRYHFAGTGIHYERQPYRNHRVLLEPAQHTTRFIGLAPLNNKEKQKWLYAFNIQPMRKMSREELTAQPSNSSEFPYMDILQEFMAAEQLKRTKNHDTVDRYRFDMSEEVEDNVDRGGRKRRRNDHPTGEKVPAAPCWFCLSNVDVEKHLVVAIGDVAYAAMPKGPLVDDHVMVLSVGHIQSMVAASDDLRNEIEKFKNAFTLVADKPNVNIGHSTKQTMKTGLREE